MYAGTWYETSVDASMCRHRLNRYLAQRIPSLFPAGRFRMCLDREVLTSRFPWRTRCTLSRCRMWCPANNVFVGSLSGSAGCPPMCIICYYYYSYLLLLSLLVLLLLPLLLLLLLHRNTARLHRNTTNYLYYLYCYHCCYPGHARSLGVRGRRLLGVLRLLPLGAHRTTHSSI